MAPAAIDPEAAYEIVYDTGAHLAADPVAELGGSILPESVVRFRMPDPGAHAHFSMAFVHGLTVLSSLGLAGLLSRSCWCSACSWPETGAIRA